LVFTKDALDGNIISELIDIFIEFVEKCTFNMKRIIVIGCPGSGKSTLSRKLHKITGITLFYLDMI